MIKLIGITGYAGSGKTTAARILVERHKFLQVKFAGPLKAMVRCLGLGDAEIEGNLKELPSAILGGKTPRHAMQTLGSEWGRDLIHPNLWVNAAMAMVDDALDHGGRVVIDDLRFPNEAEAIKSRGGMIVRIQRDGVGPVNAHHSEANDIPPDWMIYNSGTLGGLGLQLDILATQGKEPTP